MARRKCTPFGTFGTTFPRWEACHWILSRLSAPCESSSFATPEGELLAVLCIEVLMKPKAERRADFPLWGKSPQGNRGAFPSGVSPVVRFSIPRSGIIKLIAQRAIPPPLNPLNLLNLLNPHARRACPLAIPQPSGRRPVKPKNPKNLRPARAVNLHALRA